MCPRFRGIRRWMRRGVLTASVLACILVFIAWGVSFRWQYGLTVKNAPGASAVQGCQIVLNNGCINVFYTPRTVGHSFATEYLDPPLIRNWGVRPAMPAPSWSRLRHFGLVLPSIAYGGTIQYRLPLWILLLISAIPAPFVWGGSHRTSLGHCPRCNYNLTGNTSGICPECGTSC
jgi:hypothetical protein